MVDQKETQSEEEQAKSQGYYRHDIEKGVFLFLSEEEKHHAQYYRHKAYCNHKVRCWVRRAFSYIHYSSTAIIMWMTIANVIVMYVQWNTMQDQLEEMKTNSADTRAIAGATQDQARAAQDAVKVSSEQVSLTREMIRARLAVGGWLRISDIAPEVPVSFNVHFRNSGGSQAFRVVGSGGAGIYDSRKLDDCPQIEPLPSNDSTKPRCMRLAQ